MNANSEEFDLLDSFQQLFPDICAQQNDLDNPTNEFVSLFYQQFRSKLYVLLSDGVKEVEPDEGKRTDAESINSLVRFINFSMGCVYPHFDSSMTFKLLHFCSGKTFKPHARLLMTLLLNFETEFEGIKQLLVKRLKDSKILQSKREELDQLKKQLASSASEIATFEKTQTELVRSREKVQHRYQKLAQKQDAEKLVSEKLKGEVKTILEEHDNLQVLVSNIKTNVQQLNKQIITEDSYKALLNLKENLLLTCTELQNEESSVQENLHGKKGDIDRFTVLDAHINELNTLANELISAHEQYSKELAKHKHHSKTIHELSSKLKNLKSSKDQLNEKIKSRREAIHKTNLKTTDTMEKFKQELTDLKELVIKEKKKQERQLKLKQKLEENCLKLDKSCLVVKTEIDNFNCYHKELYQNIIAIENINTQNLSAALTEILSLTMTADNCHSI